jgi:biopolymer transport protein ExbD
MRRFSQRNSLVTLSDINITPLLDLAFVLLIIFVITTPLLEQSINLKLPTGGRPDKPIEKRDIRTVEINPQGSPQGVYTLDRRRVSLAQMERELVADFRSNPNLVIYIRADENGQNKYLYAVVDLCQSNGITRFSLRTEPPNER